MNAQSKIEAAPLEGLDLLRAPFPPNQISKLPKETKKQADDRKADMSKNIWPPKCNLCGGLHHKNAVHLDYVGHAAATDRLLDADICWTWEPLAVDAIGLPAFDQTGGLWIKLTVCGVTRLGYGSADGKTGGDAKKEIIGDAIRNAGMRFGMALDLWHKGDLHLEEQSEGGPGGDNSEARQVSPTGTVNQAQPSDRIDEVQLTKINMLLKATKVDEVSFCQMMQAPTGARVFQLPQSRFQAAVDMLEAKLADMAKGETNQQAAGFGEILNDEIKY